MVRPLTQLRVFLLCLFVLVASATPTQANPQGGQVTAGSATISGEGTAQVTVQQSSARAVIDWTSFSIGEGERTSFLQPDSASVTLNRVTGADPSRILGSLEANGTVILVNRNGILFSETARVDASGLVVTTHDLANDAFMEGGLLRFDRSGNPQASIVNHGTISIRNAGLAAFVAPHVVNDGVITANYGRVALGAGSAFTLDLYGDSLISFQLGDAVTETIVNDDGSKAKALVENKGRISAAQGRIQLTAEAARAVVNQSVNVTGIVEANSLSTTGGRIVLSGSGTVMTEKTAALNADGVNGGEIAVTGNAIHLDGRVTVDGSTEAPRTMPQLKPATTARAVNRNLNLQREDSGGTVAPSAAATGGSIKIDGGAFTSLDGMLSASAWSGGSILTTATRNFALNGQVMATGAGAQGGRVSITAGGETWEGSGSGIDVSGATGGTITNITQGKFVTSANYLAAGWGGAGGKIDVTGGDMFLLSATYDASGLTGGGTVRLGGEYQGGKALATDELPNARKLAANDGVKIDVSAKGNHGDAGTAIIWSDQKTTFLGSVYATGGLMSGVGGLVEASSADSLIWRGTVETAINGERGGTLLLDPKNITIADASFSQLQLVLGAFSGGSWQDNLEPGPGDKFSAVSLDGNRLAVGSLRDAGATNNCTWCGAVYLFTFSDPQFSSGTLAAVIGNGYSGGRNVNLAGILDAGDEFGASVSLDGTRLAVGAYGDDGASNSCDRCGAVYAFDFVDLGFNGGTLAARIGDGYVGGNDIHVRSNWFGSGVSLDGSRLAVGAYRDRGASNNCSECGAAYLFTFSDLKFQDGYLAAKIGSGYIGGKNINMATDVGPADLFGFSVSLDGTRLAVGSWGDGENNACDGCGEVYLFTFADPDFSAGAVAARIGAGYSGPNDINLAGILESGDVLGSGVSLEGTRLVAGAWGDDGNNNSCTPAGALSNCGAVYLFSFSNSAFSAGVLEARIGSGYSGDKNINLSTLDQSDLFGAVSLDGARLAVGAFHDAGAANDCFECGAVYLFTFDDQAFNGGTLVGRIGDGYPQLSSFLDVLDSDDQFGLSVALDGTRLAVGAYQDDGAANNCFNCGAVYLFTFSDLALSGGVLESRIGHGYVGGKNFDLTGLIDPVDQFGAVSLDTRRLAVGAFGDDGATNGCIDCGAVYLFSFDDNTFYAAKLDARVGHGYSGDKNINLAGTLNAYDSFGLDVSLDGERLAVGSGLDGGANNDCHQCGAAYLFAFTDTAYSGGTLSARIGWGYEGSNDINLSGLLGPTDVFGTKLSLDGTRLAVGSIGDDGAFENCVNCGAVYLFNFTDTAFTGGALTARIGDGYTGGKNVNLAGTLGSYDLFGHSASLDGSGLAVGATLDDGANNDCFDCGAVYLFSFSDLAFTGGVLESRIGDAYSGGKNINLSGQLTVQEWFGGSSVSLDGNRLAVGARLNDGSTGDCYDCGAVYLFTLGSTTSLSSVVIYSDTESQDTTISSTQLTALLNTGTNVTLQASNDITVNRAIIAANPAGASGGLTLQAGRSIFVNANIFTDDGDLTLIANDLLANGVVDAYRDPGAAAITMAAGTSINAGSGSVLFDMRSGAGKTNATGGAITLTSVTGGTFTALNAAASNGDIVLASGASLTATGVGNAVVLAAGDQFINNAGTTPIATPNGRFMIYSQNWGNDTRGGILASNLYSRTYGANPPASISQASNLFIYAAQPLLTVTANAASRVYGAANPAFSASITGLVNGDSAASSYAGAPGFSTTTTASSNVGTYAGDILPSLGSLVSNVGYGFSFVGGDLTITPAPLTITANDASKRFRQALTFSGTEFTVSGLLFSDTVSSVTLQSLGAERFAAPGDYAITPSLAVGSGLGNYAISYVDGLLTVTGLPRPWVPQPANDDGFWVSGFFDAQNEEVLFCSAEASTVALVACAP